MARTIIVDDRRWLDDPEFATLIGLCQALPGANTCNLAVMLGERFHGGVGAFVALAGLLIAPIALLVTVASLFARFAHLPDIHAALLGAPAAAAGLVLGTAVKMTIRIRPGPRVAIVAVAAFLGSAIARAPLLLVLCLLLPASFILAGGRE